MSISSPAAPDAHLGYTEVDDQPDLETVLAGMDATAAWPAVRQLRAWEHERLAPRPGDRVLDVGCGLGDVAIALAGAVRPGGHVVGVDVSASMVEVATRRAGAHGVEIAFRTGDAVALDEATGSFDVCRSERALQWLAEPATAVAEMVRVLRPGGRLSMIDTDWQTLTVDVPDEGATSAFRDALWRMRGSPASVGSRLLNLGRDAGLVDLEIQAATHAWTRWDPDSEAAPTGLFPLPPVVDQMVGAGLLEPSVGERFVDALVQAGRSGRFWMSIGMFAVVGKRTAD